MINLSYTEIQEFLNEASDDLPRLNISILRNIMVEPIEPYLKYLSFRIGFTGNIKFGEYDNIIQEAVLCNNEILSNDSDCVLVFIKLENLSWALARNYAALNPDDVRSEVERLKEYIATVLTGLRSHTDAMILWNSFELPCNPSLGILDAQSPDGQTATIQALNDYLRASLQKDNNAYLIDMSLCLARLGYQQFYDKRYWHIGRAPYSRNALRDIAIEIFKFIRPLKGKNKKCLVLDCDNILWGGIIGEDGLSGIQLGKSYPGSCYFEFQQEILNLYHRGIILALCSKNNEVDVWDVFNNHPDMVLKEEHIAAYQINWQDKASNLRKIAADLNIGLDSLVFIDDSDFEVNLIRRTLPDIEVIHAPKNTAIELRDTLASCGWFDTLTLSEEDKNRGVLYKAESNRKKFQEKSIDMESYYKSLEMKLEIRFANDFSIPRIAQLTQKTNQFNLTTRRYSESDITNLSDSKSSDVLCLKLMDRFGDSGIVGVCILKYIDKKAIIDSFLLSCRVLGRGVEDAFLNNALDLAKIRECKEVIGEYYPTRKNAQVADFYAMHGFEKIESTSHPTVEFYWFNLLKTVANTPNYFMEINSEIITKMGT